MVIVLMAWISVTLAGCPGGHAGHAGHAESQSPATPVRPQPAAVTVSVAAGAIDMDPVVPVRVGVANGRAHIGLDGPRHR